MEDVVSALTPVVGGVVQVCHELLVELRLLLVAEVEEGEEEDRQEEGWEVVSGVQSEEVAHMDDMWMTMSGVRARLELEPNVSVMKCARNKTTCERSVEMCCVVQLSMSSFVFMSSCFRFRLLLYTLSS